MMKSYPSFAAWKKDQTAKNKKLISRLEKLMKKTAPKLTTGVKWGQGYWFKDESPRIFIHGEPDHVQFGFLMGSALKDPYKLLQGKGKFVRHLKVRVAGDVAEKEFVALIKQAAK